MLVALLRHARLAVAPLAAVAVIVFAMAAMLAAVPALIERTATEELTTSLAALPDARRALVAETLGVPPLEFPIDPETDVATAWAPVIDAIDGVRAEAGDDLAPLLGAPQLATVSGAVPVESAQREASWPNMSMRALVDPAFDERIRIVEGVTPAARDWRVVADAEFATPLSEWEPLQVMLSTESAQRMRWSVGEVRTGINWMPVQLVGTFEALDPAAQYWQHVPSVLQPSVFDDGNSTPVVTAIGVVHPLEVPSLFSGSTTVFMPLDTAAVTFATADAVARQLQRFTATKHPVTLPGAPGPSLTLEFETDALAAVDLASGRASAAISTVVALAVPPIGAAVGILVVIAASVARRQAGPVAVARSRGASATQVRVVAGAQVAAVGLPAAVIGVLAPRLVGIEPSMPVTAIGAAALVLVVVVVAAAVPIATIEVAADRRRAGTRARVARLVAELAIGIAAVAAIVVVATGSADEGVAAAAAGAGPITVIAPLLLAITASLLVVRLLPPLLGAVATRARARRGLVGFLGPVSARGAVGSAAVLVLTTVVAVAVASASALILDRIDDATWSQTRDELLGDVRVVAPSLSPAELADLAAVDGVASVVPATFATGVTTTVDRRLSSASVLVVDAAAVPALADAVPSAAGADAVPVAVSPSLRDADGAADARVNGVEVVVATVLPGSTLRDLAVDLVVADAADGAALIPSGRSSAMAIVTLDGVDHAAAVAAIRSIVPADAVIDALDERVAVVSGQPLTALVRAALITIAIGAVALAVVGIVSAAASGARARSGTFGILRVLGTRRRDRVALGAWELLPAAVVSVAVGGAVGIGLAWLTFAGIDLSVFVGARTPVTFAIDPTVLAPVIAVVLGAVVAVVVVANAVAMRASAAQTHPSGGS